MPSTCGMAPETVPSQLTTVFWKAVSSVCRRLGRQEQRCDLTIRILQGADRTAGNTRVLIIQIWNEQDLSSLHTLEVREDDFQALKAEQGILVDFGGFPAKIIALLQRCLASCLEDPPRFQAILSIQEGVSVFKIVETNDFNQLPHLTLALRPGNDATVKSFLALRLAEVQASHASLERDLSMSQAEASRKAQQLEKVNQQLAAARAAHERHMIEAEAACKSLEANALKQRSEELMQQKEALDRQRKVVEEQLRGDMEQQQSRLASLSEELLQLREAKFGVDAAALEASHRAAAAEGTLASLEVECEGLRQRCAAAAADKAQSMADCAELRSRLASAEEKLAAQKEVMAEQAHSAKGMEGALRQLEERCADLREAASGHEERARGASAEAAKAQRAIDKLMAELQLAKEKLRRKGAVLARQEEEIAARGKALDTAAVDAQALQHALTMAQQDADARKAECADLREKLQEAKKLQQSQDDMIRWLNNQVNELQLLGTTKPRVASFASEVLKSSGLDWDCRGTSRHMPAMQSKLGASLSCYDSIPGSPKLHAAPAAAVDSALPARQPRDTPRPMAAAGKKAAELRSLAGARKGETHSSALTFSVPAFPMPEPLAASAGHAKCQQAVLAHCEAQSKSKAGSQHSRPGQIRPKGASEQAVAASRSADAKSSGPGRASAGSPVKPAGSALAAAQASASAPSLHPMGYECSTRPVLRSAIGQGIAAAAGWEVSGSATKQAAVPC